MKTSNEKQKLYTQELEGRCYAQAALLVDVATMCRGAVESESPHAAFASKILWRIEQASRPKED